MTADPQQTNPVPPAAGGQQTAIAPSKRIAVILIHGIGEQIPMETIDSFVTAAWVIDDQAQWPPPADERGGDVWFKPDPVTGSRELRRITTRWTRSRSNSADKGPRADFFEFYWADLGQGSTVEQVWDWLRTLLVRWPSQVPKGLMSAWLLLWAAAVSVGLLSLFAVLPWPGGWWHWILASAAAVVGYLMQSIVAPYAGEVARYVRAEPRNIAMRAAIRERGLQLLRALHDGKTYERIIVVGHSLGSIIGYDLISLLWSERERAMRMKETDPIFKQLRAVETAAHALEDAKAAEIESRTTAYREAQRELRLSLRSGGADGAGPKRIADEEWLISDFVTLGSPLTHAQFLLARDARDLHSKIERWLFPTDPPQFERIDTEQKAKIEARSPPPPTSKILGPKGGLFSYFLQKPDIWSIHDAASFAAVRWTNVHDPHHLIFQGDIISGPLAPAFGKGIRDINLQDLRGPPHEFTHTRYWSLPEGRDWTIDKNRDEANALPHIRILHQALDLLDRPDHEIWTRLDPDGRPLTDASKQEDPTMTDISRPQHENRSGSHDRKAFWVGVIIGILGIAAAIWGVLDARANAEMLASTIRERDQAQAQASQANAQTAAERAEKEKLQKVSIDRLLDTYNAHLNAIAKAYGAYEEVSRLPDSAEGAPAKKSAAQERLYAEVASFARFVAKWRDFAATLGKILDGNVEAMDQARERGNPDDIKKSLDILRTSFPDLRQMLEVQLSAIASG